MDRAEEIAIIKRGIMEGLKINMKYSTPDKKESHIIKTAKILATLNKELKEMYEQDIRVDKDGC